MTTIAMVEREPRPIQNLYGHISGSIRPNSLSFHKMMRRTLQTNYKFEKRKL